MPIKKLIYLAEWANKQEYRYEGKIRKGYNRPFISITPFGLDVRIKKECAPQFLADIGATEIKASDWWKYLIKFRNPASFLAYFMFWVLIKLIRLVTPLKGVRWKPNKHGKKLRGWANLFFVGAIDDPIINGNEVL